MNWANKYANIEANTASPDKEKTLLNVSSLIGEESIAGTKSDTNMMLNEKKEANIPAITTWLAFFWPKISEIKSVTKKVIGYGRIPTDSSNNLIPPIVRSKGYQ